jgi:hypothetical protein
MHRGLGALLCLACTPMVTHRQSEGMQSASNMGVSMQLGFQHV